MTEPFRYTFIPLIPETKMPAMAAGFHYDGTSFEYGADYRNGDLVQAGHVGDVATRLMPIDVDEPKPYADGTMPPPFAETHLGALLLKLVQAFPLITYVSAVSPGTKQHWYLDLRAWEGDWPQQWASNWTYDIKTAGYVRAEPAYVPVHGTPVQLPNEVVAAILTAIDHDRALHDQLKAEHSGTAQGAATGASGTWTPDIPDAVVTGDNDLTALVMSMVAHGLEDDEIYDQVERIKLPLADDWTEGQIQTKIDSARSKMESDPRDVRRFFDAFVRPSQYEKIAAEAQAEYELHQSRLAMGIPSAAPEPVYYGDDSLPAPEVPDVGWAPKGGTDQDQALSGLDEVYRRGRYLYIKEHGRLAVNAGDHWELLGDKGGAAGTLCSYLAWQMLGSSYPYDSAESKDLKKEAAGWKDDEGLDEEQVAHREEVRAKLREYRKHEDWLKWRTSAGVSGIAGKMSTMMDTHAIATSALTADNDPDILWAGGIPWDLRTCTPATWVKPTTLHFLTAGCTPDFSGRPTPLFDEWMRAALPDEVEREWVLNLMGATLIGGGKFFPELISKPGNTGKTSTVELLANLLGSYSEVLPEELLTGAQTHSEVYLRLKGKKLCYFDEQPGTGKVARNKIKSLAGSSKLSGRAVNGREVVSFKPSHTLWLTVNEDIQFDQDDALQMRIRRVYFKGNPDTVAAAAKKIWNTSRSMRPAWEAEAPAVLGKIMLRCAAYIQDPSLVTAPPHAELELIEAAAEQDTVSEWLLSQVQAKDGAKIPNDLLRSAYTEWCKRVGVPEGKRVNNSTAFGHAMGKALKRAGFENAKPYRSAAGRGYEGLALNPIAQQVM